MDVVVKLAHLCLISIVWISMMPMVLSSNVTDYEEDYGEGSSEYYSGSYYYEYFDLGMTFEDEWGEEHELQLKGDWTNWNAEGDDRFSCFTDAKVQEYRDMFQVTEEELLLNNGTHFQSDDWGFGTLAVDIILREIFGFQISMSSIYEMAIPILENSWQFPVETGARVPFFHLELWASDFTFWDLYRYASPEVDISLMGTPFFWVIMVREETLAEVEAEIGDSTTFLDVWRTFLDPKVIDAMASPNQIGNQQGALCDVDQWTFDDCLDVDVSEYTGIEGAVLVNGTYYPPQCPVDDHADCMVLISFLPDYSLHLHADLIQQYGLKWVVKYIGGEWQENTLALFQELYENERVLFEVYRPSVFGAGAWRYIAVPVDHPFSEQDQIFRGVSSRMQFVSRFANHLVSSGFIMSSEDYDVQNEYIRNISGIHDGDHLPISCKWLQEHESSWTTWIDLGQKPKTDTLCNRVTDETLQKLLEFRTLSDLELEGEVMFRGADMFNDLDSSMEDLYSIQYAMAYCIKSYDGGEDPLFLMNHVLSGLGLASMVILGVAILWFKDHQIMIASSETMCCVLIIGGIIGLCFSFLSDSNDAASCYARPYIIQIGLTLMCGSIMVKTWRLNKYIVAAKQYRVPGKISDLQCFVRILTVCFIVVSYLTIILALFPMEVGDEVVIDGVIYPDCLWSDEFKISYQILVALQTLKLALVAMDAWNLRNIGQQFNESKFIGIILYHNVVLVGAMLIVEELTMLNPNVRFVITNLLVTTLVFIISFILLIPKFINIYRGVEYSDKMSIFATNADSDQLVIQKSQMSKVDILKIKKLLKSYGYDVVKRKSANDSAQFGLMELSSRAPSAMSKRGRSQRKQSKEQPLVGNMAPPQYTMR